MHTQISRATRVYDRNEHLKISQSFHEELIKIHGDWSEKEEQDVIKVMKYLFIPFLHDLGISASQMQFSDNLSVKQNTQEHLSCHRGSTNEALLPEFVILYNDANILDLDFGNDLCEMTVFRTVLSQVFANRLRCEQR